MFTTEQIENLRPSFNLGGQLAMSMVEWFTFHAYENRDGIPIHCTIKSGLRHADGETRSPYHYEETFFGVDCTEKARAHFSCWWVRVHQERDLS